MSLGHSAEIYFRKSERGSFYLATARQRADYVRELSAWRVELLLKNTKQSNDRILTKTHHQNIIMIE